MNRDMVDPWLVAGSSFYWSAVVLSFAFDGVSISPAADPSGVVGVYGWVAAIIACFLPARFLFERRRSRRGVALAMACVVAAYVAAHAFPGVPDAIVGLLSGVYLVEVACQMVLWGFAYASFDKSRACQNVCCTILAVVLVVSGASLLFKWTGIPYLTCFLNMASLMVAASGRVFFSSRPHALEVGARRPVASFVVSRLAFGVFIGFCMQLPGGTDIGAGSTAMTVLAGALGAGMLAAHLVLHAGTASMPVALVMGICLLFLPHLGGGYKPLVSSAAGFAWLAWVSMSAAQLSELKERCGVREFTLCVVEKGLLCLAIVVGSAGCLLLGTRANVDASGLPVQMFVCGGLLALVLVAAFTMARLLENRQRDEFARRLEAENRELASALYGRLAREYRLSDREAQVMAFLAEGYSRTHIRDALGISEGTVKAHVAHLYQKMGIHRKDELLDLVEARR